MQESMWKNSGPASSFSPCEPNQFMLQSSEDDEENGRKKTEKVSLRSNYDYKGNQRVQSRLP